jgi:hypothetical protein
MGIAARDLQIRHDFIGGKRIGGGDEEGVDLRHRPVDAPGAADCTPLADEFIPGGVERRAGAGGGGVRRIRVHVLSDSTENIGKQGESFRAPYSVRRERPEVLQAKERNFALAVFIEIGSFTGSSMRAARPIRNSAPRGSAEWDNRTSQVIRRINSKLGPKGEILRMAKTFGAALSLGRYYTVDLCKNRITRTHLDLEKLRREENV